MYVLYFSLEGTLYKDPHAKDVSGLVSFSYVSQITCQVIDSIFEILKICSLLLSDYFAMEAVFILSTQDVDKALLLVTSWFLSHCHWNSVTQKFQSGDGLVVNN